MACHQSHNIPWLTLSELIDLPKVMRDKHMNTKSPGFQEFIEPYKGKSKHFIECFKRVVGEFQQTERSKYSTKDIKAQRFVFTNQDCHNDDLLNFDSYKPVLESDSPLQQFNTWKAIGNGSSLTKEANIIKVLFNRNQITPIMALVTEYGIPLHSLERITYSNFFHYGIKRVFEDSLVIYLSLNADIASGTLNKATWDQEKLTMVKCRTSRLAEHLFSSQDYTAHSQIYVPFFYNVQRREKDSPQLMTGDVKDTSNTNEISKIAFRLLYQYAMVLNECNHPIEWETELQEIFTNVFKLEFLYQDN